jgi:uncharacterized membrane protein YraQ (UPF0718 family)
MSWIWMSLYHALTMLWETFWALVLGFGFSALLQVFVSKEQMTRAFGRAGLREIAIATGLGAASSSCSYAAAAAGRSAFEKGAALVPVLAFMFASTNLVIELGAVLWLLMGWRFVLAEVVGSFVLIATMWLLVKLLVPANLEGEARRNAEGKGSDGGCSHGHGEHGHEHGHASGEVPAWTRVANAFVMDWSMLWKEILGGFLIAGFLMTLVRPEWWQAFFVSGGPAWFRTIENVAVGPLIAVASFVCSVGNIPLASLLWANGISFGGVISFIYGDLIVVPLILIYAKYYGARAAGYIALVLYVAMVISGLIVDLLFAAAGLIPAGARSADIVHATITWDYSTWLDLAALVIFAVLVVLHIRSTNSPATA